jgi:O-antigen/teichoic acid export membrane protein
VGLDKSQYNALITNVQALAKTTISITLVLLGFSVTSAVIGYSTSYVVAAVAGTALLYLLLRQNRDRTKTAESLTSELKTLMHYGTPLYVSILLTGPIPFYQNLILANYTTDADIGNYKAAANFATLITVFSIPITTTLLPAFSKIGSSATQKTRMFFKLANKYTTLIMIPVTTLVILYSTEIVKIIYGSTCQFAPLFLSVHSLLYFLVGLGYLTLASFYNGPGETRTNLIISLITFLTLATLSPTLTQTYGVQGLVAAFLIASTAGTTYATHKARRKFQIEFDTPSLLKTYLVSAISGIPPLLMTHFVHLPETVNLAIGVLTYLSIYITLAPLTKIITPSELQTITNITKRIRPLGFITKPIVRCQRKILHLEQTQNQPKTAPSQ